MRVQIAHRTAYSYDVPAKAIIQMLRVTPRNHVGQHVMKWRVEVDVDARLRQGQDSFGNTVHTLDATGSIGQIAISVDGEVETTDTNGVVEGTLERFPPILFVRDTPLTGIDEALAAYAEDIRSAHGGANADKLDLLHALLGALHKDMLFDPRITAVNTPAAKAFALKRGVCQDITHVFLAAARHLEIPARYISGYFHRADGVIDQEAGHAWAEAHVPGLGWVGFDATNGFCVGEAHVRVAVGLDYLSAAPVRGSRTGGGNEWLNVDLRIAAEENRSRNQSQDQLQS